MELSQMRNTERQLGVIEQEHNIIVSSLLSQHQSALDLANVCSSSSVMFPSS